MRDRDDGSNEEASDGGWQAAVDRPRGMDTDGVVITLPWARKGEPSSFDGADGCRRGGAHGAAQNYVARGSVLDSRGAIP